ncbi:MAG: ABC transporter ATP-binding protein [Chromatiaceae bacterium]|nr:ABC transporter ATP-binding protein [Chromatiaceae bacterium]
MASSSPDPGPIIETQGLTKIYPLGDLQVEALRGVDLQLWPGELVVMLGPSGSGKSTLLNLLGGLDRPSAGSVQVLGQSLGALSERALTLFRRERVGFVFQFYNLIPSLTARENVALVTDIARNPMPPEEALDRVGLGARQHHFPSQLSGGEQQRVAIARALAKRPALLLCDEPTGALDSATGVRVLEVLGRVNRELGATTVLITHNAAIAAMADRVVRMADGRIQSVATNAEPQAPGGLIW